MDDTRDILSNIYKQQHQITTVTNQIAVNKTTVITCLVSHTTTPTTMTTMATTTSIWRDLTLSFVDDVNLVGREVVFETHRTLVGRANLMPRAQMSYGRLLFLIYFVAYLTDKLQNKQIQYLWLVQLSLINRLLTSQWKAHKICAFSN